MVKPVYFYGNADSGSYRCSGYNFFDILKKQGYPCYHLDIRRPVKLESIQNSIIVIVKCGYQTNIIQKFKQQGNKIVWIINDIFAVDDPAKATRFDRRLCNLTDFAIFPNKKTMKDYSGIFPASCLKDVSYHQADNLIFKPNTQHDKFSLLYIGERRNCMHVDKIPDLTVLSTENHRLQVRKDYDFYLNHNCHISLRSKTNREFFYKPGAKLGVAIATESNIIMTRDYSFTEVLPEYPYYTDEDFESVMSTIEKVKSDFGTKKWDDALAQLKTVENQLSYTSLADQYVQFFGRLQ